MALGTQTKKVLIEVGLDDKASAGLRKMQDNTDKASSSIVGSFSKIAVAATAVIATVKTAYSTISKGLDVAGELETATQGFKALLGSSSAAQKVMERIKKEAKTTPFEISGLVKGAQALTAITKNGDEAIDILLDVGKAVALSGKGQEELERVIYNLQQIAATGKVTELDIRQFQSAIPVFNDVLEYSGLTTEGLKETEDAAELLFKAFDKYGTEGAGAKAFTEQAGTWKQLLSNAKDSWKLFTAALVEDTGIFEVAKEVAEGVAKVIGRMQDRVERLSPWLESLGVVFEEQLKPALKDAMVAYNKMLDSMGIKSVNIIEPLIYLMAGVVLGMTVMAKAAEKLYTWITKLVEAVGRLVNKYKELNKENPWNNPVTGIISLFDKKATGGITSGGMTMVGEAGPELVKLPRGSHVYNNTDSKQMIGGGGITINVNAPVTGVDNLKATIIEAVNEATARQNRLANYNLL